MDEVSAISKCIRNEQFPCVMARAVEKTGGIKIVTTSDLLNDVKRIHDEMSCFVDDFRKSEKLRSFILMCESKSYPDFDSFESHFWQFLSLLRAYDRSMHPHDPRVAEDPMDDGFSFSIKSEAFFILMLHPESSRWARRFYRPAIVFNPHVQFERLRVKGIFKKIQTLIRTRDKLLQGSVNPMLSDYGDRSEVFQYTGRVYSNQDEIPLFS